MVRAPKESTSAARSRNSASSPSAPPINRVAAGVPASRAAARRFATGGWQALADQLGFLAPAFLGAAAAALGELDHVRPAQTEPAGQALGAFLIAGTEIALRPVLEAANRDDREAHARSPCVRSDADMAIQRSG